MSSRLARGAYERLVEDDVARVLDEMAPSLERDHVVAVLRASADHEYGALPVLRTCGGCGHAPSRYARPRVCQHPVLFDREDPVLLAVEHGDAPPSGCPLRGAR